MLRSDTFGFLTGNLNSLVYMLNPRLGIWAMWWLQEPLPHFLPPLRGSLSCSSPPQALSVVLRVRAVLSSSLKWPHYFNLWQWKRLFPLQPGWVLQRIKARKLLSCIKTLCKPQSWWTPKLSPSLPMLAACWSCLGLRRNHLGKWASAQDPDALNHGNPLSRASAPHRGGQSKQCVEGGRVKGENNGGRVVAKYKDTYVCKRHVALTEI